MHGTRSLVALAWFIALALAATPTGAQAPPPPPSPTSDPHPAMPWSGPWRGAEYGQFVRYLPVPGQQTTIEVPVPTPEGVPRQTQQQVVEIPGYYVAETTTGYWYPERWTLEKLNEGVYQWRLLPAEFRRK